MITFILIKSAFLLVYCSKKRINQKKRISLINLSVEQFLLSYFFFQIIFLLHRMENTCPVRKRLESQLPVRYQTNRNNSFVCCFFFLFISFLFERWKKSSLDTNSIHTMCVDGSLPSIELSHPHSCVYVWERKNESIRLDTRAHTNTNRHMTESLKYNPHENAAKAYIGIHIYNGIKDDMLLNDTHIHIENTHTHASE